jgi:hypothetical protein
MNRNHKLYLAIVASFLLGACGLYLEKSEVAAADSGPSLFSVNEIWDLIKEMPYDNANLPVAEVTLESFYNFGVDHLLASAKRTIENKSDILPHFDKLLHPNGVCLRGIWKIDSSSAYSGYFSQGARGLIIARASTTLSNTRRGRLRGFGLAGKMFPSVDADKKLQTANFFVIDNIGGTYAQNYTEVSLTNEPNLIPTVSIAAFNLIQIAQAAQKALSAADINPGIRQLYPISSLGLKSGFPKTPKWMKIQGLPSERKSTEEDFRNEIIDHIAINGVLNFVISVADETDFLGSKKWQRLGNIEFVEAIASEACDHQLHFPHNKFVENQ